MDNIGILEPGFELTLRPMKYPKFYQHFQDAIKNTWTVDEISFSTDVADLRDKLSPSERHVISRLVAFFATGDTIVGNNLVLSLFKHVNSPEVRLYYGRQIFEESLHVDFYLRLLDNYIKDDSEREQMFKAIETIPSIKKKADFCFKWMDQVNKNDVCDTDEKKKIFLMNLITFACAIEGLFFFGAFAYVYYLRSKGLLNGLASGTNWVFRDESLHMNVAFDIIDVVKQQYPYLWDAGLQSDIKSMLEEAITCELQFSHDVLSLGIAGLSKDEMKQYLEYVADMRLSRLGIQKMYHKTNPFGFMDLQDVTEHTNFFERTVAQYQKGVVGEVDFDADF